MIDVLSEISYGLGMDARTKRSFDGIQPTGKKIGDLLPQILRKIQAPQEAQTDAVFQFWFSLMDEKTASLTQLISWKNGILTIKVKSATLYALLCQHEKKGLLQKMQTRFRVQDIVFRIG